MKKVIELNEVESCVRKMVNAVLECQEYLSVEKALNLMVDFYNDFQIANVNIDLGKDYDMLLFQYGMYDFLNGEEEKFKINFTRQFDNMDGSEELWQLKISLFFDKDHFLEIKRNQKWSDYYSDIEEWIDFVKNTEGFQKAKTVKPVLLDIYLDQT